MPTTRPSAGSCRTCSVAAFGSKARTAGSTYDLPTLRCARSTRMASMRCWQTFARAASTSDIPLMVTGATHARKDQIGIVGGDRPVLHHQQEQEADAGEDGNQEVRSRRP